MKNNLCRTISRNRKAKFNYEILNTYEAGVVLKGVEVKSLRKASVNLKDSYCVIQKGEIFVLNMYIAPYEQGNIFNKDPLRKRKLLMHKKEILKLYDIVKQKGFSIIPISIYFNKALVKVNIALCKGRKIYDKRENIKAREIKRKIERNLKKNQNWNFLGGVKVSTGIVK